MALIMNNEQLRSIIDLEYWREQEIDGTVLNSMSMMTDANLEKYSKINNKDH